MKVVSLVFVLSNLFCLPSFAAQSKTDFCRESFYAWMNFTFPPLPPGEKSDCPMEAIQASMRDFSWVPESSGVFRDRAEMEAFFSTVIKNVMGNDTPKMSAQEKWNLGCAQQEAAL